MCRKQYYIVFKIQTAELWSDAKCHVLEQKYYINKNGYTPYIDCAHLFNTSKEALEAVKDHEGLFVIDKVYKHG